MVNFIYDLQNNAHSVLFPGDITVHKLSDVADRVRASQAKCRFMLAPHHGSLNTNFIIDDNGTPVDQEFQPLYIMYKKIIGGKENLIVTYISECMCNKKYCTPCGEFVNIAEEFAPNVDQHTIYMFDNGRDKNPYNSRSIDVGVYLTGALEDNYAEITLIGTSECPAPHKVERPEKTPRTLPPDYLFV